ncbi:tetratricopeptide repeat protein [Methylomonas methanica]|uniref:tetratricopeptide repeat protein n=1 Tax=Methylomonas methanica TaxID=421 RepID=UPI00031EC91A|nr:tetratricopeptide repeat protein [Methylomonas methanica]
MPVQKPPRYPTKKQLPGTATYPIDDGKNNFKVEPSQPAFGTEPLAPLTDTAPAPGVPALPAFAVEEARIPTGTPPAVVALLTEADRNRASGNLDAAVVSTERALRIDSRNPTLTYKLAQLRIKQNKPQLAEELAGKAALLAGADLDLKRKSWLLIAEARRMQQNYRGAKEAKAKSESFFGR